MESSVERQKPAELSPPYYTHTARGQFLLMTTSSRPSWVLHWSLRMECENSQRAAYKTFTELGLFCDGNHPGVVDTMLRTVWYFFKRLNLELPYDPAILLAARVMKTHVYTKTPMRVLIEKSLSRGGSGSKAAILLLSPQLALCQLLREGIPP